MPQNEKIQLEILISTMNRTTLDFLKPIFRNCDINQLQLLIVNQTTTDRLLESPNPNIKVINSFEKGLSRSRNLAITNAKGEYCLIADDDVVYINEFHKTVLNSFAENKYADLITFKTLTDKEKPFSHYPKNGGELKGFVRKVLSIEIAFKRTSLLNSNVRFDEHFGLGSRFEDSENFLFIKELQQIEGFKSYFVPEFIVQHKAESSSDEVGSDRFIFARSALHYKLYGNLAYFYIIKLLVSLFRKGIISFSDLNHKFAIAKKGIATFKEIYNE